MSSKMFPVVPCGFRVLEEYKVGPVDSYIAYVIAQLAAVLVVHTYLVAVAD